MTLIVQALLAVLEFLLVNWVGRHSISAGYYPISFVHDEERSPLFNAVFRVLAPTVFLVITAAIWYSVGLDEVVQQYWRVTVFYFGIRWAFNLVTGRGRLLRWVNQVIIAALAIGLSYLTYQQILIDRTSLLPSARGLTDQVWIIVILFLYSTYNRLTLDNTLRSAGKRREDYINAQYKNFRRRFGAIVQEESTSTAAEAIAYSVMIYESFNRPPIYQAIERWILHPLGLAKSLGPMQVQVSRRQRDGALVREGVSKVSRDLSRAWAELGIHDTGVPIEEPGAMAHGQESSKSVPKPDFTQLSGPYRDDLVRRTAAKYNIRSDYPEQVLGIYTTLIALHYRELEP